MAEVIKMPKMSDTMTEGVIAKWHKKVGDKVKSGDILAEVETDKATMELESYEDGTLLHIGVQEKDSVPVDSVLAIIGEKGENIDSLLKSLKNGNTSSEATAAEEKKEEAAPQQAKKEAVDTSSIKATVVRMPKMSDTMTDGTIVAWHKKVGDKVKSGDLLAEVETDKATMELESYEDGTLLYIGVKEGDAVKVDGVLAVIGESGANYEALLDASSNGVASPAKEKESPKEDTAVSKQEASQASVSSSDGSRVKISPLAKKLAQDKGIDIKAVKGSGDNGRIVKKDIEEFKPSEKPSAPTQKPSEKISLPSVVGEESFEEVAVSQMRKTIAKRLAESKFGAPHFYLTMEINMDKAMASRVSINEISPVKVSFNDIVIKAVAVALRSNPKVNSSWLGDKIRYNKHIHIGVAVAVEEGLLVPVVRFADTKTLSHIAAEVKDLGAKAKNKQLTPADWAGNTFTISNLGMFGIEEFTAIINPPDACILAVGGIKQTPVVQDGQIKIGNVMKVTLSCDHRVVDGAIGSAFLQTLKSLLEDPIRLLV
ncbi:MAG TPA: pyruvate dehydrogenase complex dihydrolipoamide acetyltransferase [Cytophagales bacterium]|nr:pyruvate dehydrogenase complex dihydrolipoamide acetyltransferase [Cytophagales bacterium]